MEKIELKKGRVALEKIKKQNLLANSDNKYDYEKYKFKVVAVAKDCDQSLIGKTIIKQENLGINIELSGKELIIISEDSIIAEI